MASNFWSLQSLRRGLNNTDPPHAIDDEQCTVATNVEFNLSTLGERRKGCVDVDLPTSITADANMQVVTFLHRHLPTTDDTASELWVLAMHQTTQNLVLTRKTTSWTSATFRDESIEVTSNQGFQVQGVTLHGKLFLAFPAVGGVDRLHVVNASGTEVRRCGLAEPAAPTAADTAVAGTYTGTRYFRVRYCVLSGSTVLLRSEPSDTRTFAPNGSFDGAIITKPASISEGETHWEIEASVDNANFYRIARQVVGTTTYTDQTVYASGYANVSGAVLSADSGDYTVPYSAKFLTVDEDRLIMAGAWETTAYASRVSWTPVGSDPEGDGNDERIPVDTDNFVDLDGFEGGPITAMSRPIDGGIWVFKKSHTYKLIRTGRRERAYEVVTISKSLGAIPGSLVEGVDAYGMPCLYFLDPETGPCRTGGARQIQACSRDVLETWKTINLNATQVVARALYYPESRQVHFWIATGSSNSPDLKMVLQTNETREQADGVRGGWALANGKISEAYAVCMYAQNIDDNTTRSLVLRPFVGTSAANEWVLRCDTGTTDDGEAYAARIVTKPFTLRNNLSKFGILAASLLAKADATADIKVTLIRDYGLEEPKTVETTVAASGSETQVIKQLRNFVGSQMYACQIEFEDIASPDGQWQLQRFDARISDQDSA